MDNRAQQSRRALLATGATVAAGTAGCLRLAADEESDVEETGPEFSVEAVEFPDDVVSRTPIEIEPMVRNGTDERATVTVVVAIDETTISRESLDIRPGHTRSTTVTHTVHESGANDVVVHVYEGPVEDGYRIDGALGDEATARSGGDEREPADRWDGSVTVTGRALELEWEETFVPAEATELSRDDRHLAFACQTVEFSVGEESIAEYDLGADDDLWVVDGAYPRETVSGERSEDGEETRGRWLGTESKRTEFVFLDHEPVEDAEVCRLIGHTLFDERSTVTAVLDGDPVDTAEVPSREAGPTSIEIDLD